MNTIMYESAVDNVVESTKENISVIQKMINDVVDWAEGKIGSLFLALLFVFVGFKVVKIILKLVDKGFERRGIDKSVESFLNSLIKAVLYILVLITAATIMGIQMTSFIALLTSAGVAISLALQGSLANFAGGVLILLVKPYKVGDYIVEGASGNEGTVTAIDIFYTKLATTDNRLVVIPNGALTNSTIINVTAYDRRRLDMTIGVSYHSDIDKVKQVINDVITSEERVIQTDPIDIFIDKFDDSEITMRFRFGVATKDYWAVKWDTNERIKKAFDENDITIPFKQVDVHIDKEEKTI